MSLPDAYDRERALLDYADGLEEQQEETRQLEQDCERAIYIFRLESAVMAHNATKKLHDLATQEDR